MAETATTPRSVAEDFFGSALRDGKVFASNCDSSMEESYPVAYNLGCGGKHWSGWVNVDARADADLTSDLRKLPIESDSADAVAAIHVLEHFYYWEVFDLLTEWKRILKPGGKMILELPCLDKVFGYVAKCVQAREPMAEFMTLLALYGDPKHEDPAMCHKWGWFTAPLIDMLKSVGMREITVCEAHYHFVFRDFRIECVK